MAYKGNQNQYVIDMMKSVDAASEELYGMDEHPRVNTASETSVLNFTDWADPWNPLYCNPEYAKNSKYGGIIAAPMYIDSVLTLTTFPKLDPAGGFMYHNFAGEDWSNMHVVHVGDTFKVMHNALSWGDITIDGEDTTPDFYVVFNNADAINQNGDIVASYKGIIDVSVLSGPPTVSSNGVPYERHTYTQEEWDYINGIAKNEEIRGATPRYWEDVTPGEVVTPCTIGPTTRWDMLAFYAAHQEFPFYPIRVYRERTFPDVGPLMPDEYNVTHMGVEWHNCSSMARMLGDPLSFNYGASGRTQMARLVTNWMGDDGELRGFKWRHLRRTYMGECLIVQGRVVKRYITEDGEYAVDLDVWMDNAVRGNVSESAQATVILPVRNPDNPNLKDMFFDVSPKRMLEYGDRVRVVERTDLFPTGYPLSGAEGVVKEMFPWQRTEYNSYGNYVTVEIDKCDTILRTGNILFLKEDFLEKI